MAGLVGDRERVLALGNVDATNANVESARRRRDGRPSNSLRIYAPPGTLPSVQRRAPDWGGSVISVLTCILHALCRVKVMDATERQWRMYAPLLQFSVRSLNRIIVWVQESIYWILAKKMLLKAPFSPSNFYRFLRKDGNEGVYFEEFLA